MLFKKERLHMLDFSAKIKTYLLQRKHDNEKINLSSDTKFRITGDNLDILKDLGGSLINLSIG